MAYIGNKPTVGNFQICDAISVVNGQASYTMQVGSVNVLPETANHMIVSLNGTIQKPNSSYTVSGSTITFSSNLATGDVIDFIQILGDVLDLGVPSDGTVTNAKLASGSFSNITGTGTLAGFTSTGIDDNADATAITIDAKENVAIGITPSDFSTSYSSKALQVTDVTSLFSMAVSTGDRRTILGNNLFIGTDNNRKFVTAGAKQSFLQQAEGVLTFHSDNSTGSAGASSSTSQRFQVDSIGNMKVSRNGAALNSNSTHQLIDAGANSYSLMLSNKASSPASQYMLEIGFKSASPDNSAAKFIEANDSTTTRFRVNSDGDCQNHDNSYGSTSDERIKQDIIDATSQWEDIKNIRIRNFKKKDDVRQYGENAKPQIGVIAQEIETVSPGLIKEQEPNKGDILSSSEFGELYQKDDDIPENKEVGDIKTISSNVKSVNYSVLYMKSVKALQEAMTRIETLEARITTLENA